MSVALGIAAVRVRVIASITMMASVALCLLLSGRVLANASPAAHEHPGLLTDPVPDPHQEDLQWFASTGHTVRGSFLQYWEQNGGLTQFGYPITEEFIESSGAEDKAAQVQYFERSRFELHPENAGTQYEVLLGMLGRDFHAQDTPTQQLGAPALYFPQTGHNISGAFQQYWETHGSLAIHGYPFTEPFTEKDPTDGKEYTVQYFERSRFELHPENTGSPYEVQLGLLGRQLSEKKGYPYGWYPQYGRATDWSWVSGTLISYVPGFLCDALECGCVLLDSEGNRGTMLQLVNSNDPMIPLKIWPEPVAEQQNSKGISLVTFGKPTAPNQAYFTCKQVPAAQGYLATSVRTNPSR